MEIYMKENLKMDKQMGMEDIYMENLARQNIILDIGNGIKCMDLEY